MSSRHALSHRQGFLVRASLLAVAVMGLVLAAGCRSTEERPRVVLEMANEPDYCHGVDPRRAITGLRTAASAWVGPLPLDREGPAWELARVELSWRPDAPAGASATRRLEVGTQELRRIEDGSVWLLARAMLDDPANGRYCVQAQIDQIGLPELAGRSFTAELCDVTVLPARNDEERACALMQRMRALERAGALVDALETNTEYVRLVEGTTEPWDWERYMAYRSRATILWAMRRWDEADTSFLAAAEVLAHRPDIKPDALVQRHAERIRRYRSRKGHEVTNAVDGETEPR